MSRGLRVGKGEPTFVNFRLPSPQLRVVVTGPQMLVSHLRLTTDLGALDGYWHPALEALADDLAAVSHCGTTGPVSVDIVVVTNRLGATLEIGVGPKSMYETELVIATRSGISIEALLASTVACHRETGFIAGLVPVAAIGHQEHLSEMGLHVDEDNDVVEVRDAKDLALQTAERKG